MAIECMRHEGFFFQYRGNGYGPFSTEGIARSEARGKLSSQFPVAHISTGWVEVNSRKGFVGHNLIQIGTEGVI